MNKFKNEKGSLALFVTIAMLFFMAFLLVIFISTTNQQKTQLAVTARIKETYEQDLDNVNEIYNSFVGTEENIPIYSAEQLKKVGSGESVYISEIEKNYKFNLNSNYILKNNIDLNQNKYTVSPDGTISFNSDAEQWTPIGTSSTPFTGTFDGNGYKINGLYINNNNQYQGLFGYNSGTIQNVILDNGYLNAASYFGSIASYNNENGNIISCINKNDIESTGGLGGIVGINAGKILNCLNEGNITNKGSYDVGGIVGQTVNTNSLIENCINKGNITGKKVVGGIVGYLQYGGIIKNSYNEGILFSDDAERSDIGGIVGLANATTNDITIENCFNLNKVYGDVYVGGILGRVATNTLAVNVENCYNKGNIISNRTVTNSDNFYHSNVGGICGYNSGKLNITECYNEGQIEGNGIGIGGIAGYTGATGKIEKSYNLGKIVGGSTQGSTQAGGIVGSQCGNYIVQLCYNLGEINGISAIGGITGNVGWTTYGYIEDCYNFGVVKSTVNTSSYIGGIAGVLQNGKIENCYNIQNVYVVDEINGSGILGGKGTSTTIESYSKDVTNCYYLTDTATGGINGADVEGQAEVKTSEEMKADTFVTLLNNGENNWKFVSGKNDGYPILSWQN